MWLFSFGSESGARERGDEREKEGVGRERYGVRRARKRGVRGG